MEGSRQRGAQRVREPRGVVPTSRIIFGLLEPALALPGHVAECGVWQARPDPAGAVSCGRRDPPKRVMGFDSFQGLDQTVSRDVELGGDAAPASAWAGFSTPSYEAVAPAVRQFGLSGPSTLRAGVLSGHAGLATPIRGFCFVHLDCVLYESIGSVLEFFFSFEWLPGASCSLTNTRIRPGRLHAGGRRVPHRQMRNESSRSRATTTSVLPGASSEGASRLEWLRRSPADPFGIAAGNATSHGETRDNMRTDHKTIASIASLLRDRALERPDAPALLAPAARP